MWSYPALRNRVPALDLNIIHPLSADCLSLLHPYDRKHQILRLGWSPWKAAKKGSDLLGLDFWHSALYGHHHSTSHCIDGPMESSQVREHLPKKIMFSFGHCPNYLSLNVPNFLIRLSNERARNRRPSSSREPQAVASSAPLQADDERHTGPQQDVRLSSEMQKAASLTSMLLLIFAIPILIFGMCLNKGYSVTPFDSYFMKFWLGMSN